MSVADKLKALRIKANLIADDEVGLMEISTEVNGDKAILTGDVENEDQKRIAEELAYEIEGISQVINKLNIVSIERNWLTAGGPDDAHLGYGLAEGSFGETAFSLSGSEEFPGPGIAASEQFPGQFTDAEIDEEVHDRLAEQTEVDASQIEYATNNQIVRLTGSVRRQEDLNKLLDVIINTRGVMGIDSSVRIEQGEVGTPAEDAES
jgi:osmotically-inducible protein OsmY